MPVIFFALISYVGWGTGDVVGAVATRRLGAYSTTLWSAILSLLLFASYMPFSINDLYKLTPVVLFITLAIGVIFLIAFLSFNQAMIVGNPAIVGAIVSAYSSIAVVLSIVFLGERISLPQGAVITLIFIGIVLTSVNINEFWKGKVITGKAIIYSLIALLCFGVYATFIRIPIDQIGWFWPSVLVYISLLCTLLVVVKIRKVTIKKPTQNRALLPLLVSVLLLRSGELAYGIALTKELTAIVAPIAGAYPTLFVPLAFLVFRERVTKQQIGGIVLTVIGIVLLSLFSV